MARRNKYASGFSLVEMLVVVGIIGILAGILIPGLRLARERTKQVKCAANIKQLLVALNLYEQEYRTFPILKNDGTLISSLYPAFVDNAAVFHCPGHIFVAGEHFTDPKTSNTTCYACNDTLPADGLTTDNPLYLLSSTVLLIDSLYDIANANPRHNNGSNLGFADGHVEWYSRSAYCGADPDNPAKTGWKNWGNRQ